MAKRNCQASRGKALNSDAILDRLRFLHPRVIDLSLDRVSMLLERLGHPQDKLPPVIHVAGTNGKGSVIAFLRAILEACGHTVHVYTSPHLVRFNERIVVAGREIDDATLVDALETCESINDGKPITFFEITTAAALLAFAATPADFCLLETGLGGRLDATNLIDRPRLTMLTPISLDHQGFLGETVAEIAAEKAGILKPGVACIVAPQTNEAMDVIRDRAAGVGSPLSEYDRSWRSIELPAGGFRFDDAQGSVNFPAPALNGRHQIANAGHAVAAVRALEEISTDDATVCTGLRAASWPGRLQHLSNGSLADLLPSGVELWLDGGHNPAAAAALAAYFQATGQQPLLIIVGMLGTKDARRFLKILAPVTELMFCIPVPGTTEGVPPEKLAELARDVGITARLAEGISDALRQIAPVIASGERVLICGSLYLAGSALKANTESIIGKCR